MSSGRFYPILSSLIIGGTLLLWNAAAIAQIRPDDTLGGERSRVTRDAQVRGAVADRIDGGARRGANLFHSFEDFNVDDFQRVYFSNPAGIANILSRVTGENRSDILGTLGVDGNANLFLINPNGIVFGPNAVLDVDGAFLASTADHFVFDDGSLFSATDPNAPPLVTVNIPIGVQFGPNPPASIINEADLEAGGDLALIAGTVTNIGNLTAGGQVQVEEVVDSLQLGATPDDSLPPQMDDGARLISDPDAAFEVSWIDPAEQGIQPDATLGDESSVLVEGVEIRGEQGNRIDGGATRGTNLFHSFTAFNVEDGDRVYFSNPAGIETILSRVTGTGRSDVMGTLGVDGNADLFMINPNGMIFGPNAQLDVSGSFLASTADRFTWGDGLEFRTDEPNEAPTVAVNMSPGVQIGDTSQRLVNQAVLSTPDDLTLSARGVTSTGSLTSTEGTVAIESIGSDALVGDVLAQSVLLQADETLSLIENEVLSYGNLTLQAGDTVHIRDSVENQFLAVSSGDMLIQGNESIDILALNHLDTTPFQSGGNLTLASDGTVSADAHFYSVGDYSIQTLDELPGNLISLYDPIISAAGDIAFGDYEGVALKVESQGNITVTGNITITAPDDTLPDGLDPDIPILQSSAALILRAGLAELSNPQGIVGDDSEFNLGIPPANLNPGGINITSSTIRTLPLGADGDTTSGPVILDATGKISIIDSFINTTTVFGEGNGSAGNVTITSTYSASDTDAQAIELADPAIELINTQIDAASFNDAGTSGDVTIQAENGAVVLASENNSLIYTDTFATEEPIGGPQTGGDLRIEGVHIDIRGYLLVADVRPSVQGDGGDIRIESRENGTINVADTLITTRVNADASGDAGNIFIGDITSLVSGTGNTDQITISNSNIFSDALVNAQGNAGSIFIGSNSTVDIRDSSISNDIRGTGAFDTSNPDIEIGQFPGFTYVDSDQINITNSSITNTTNSLANAGSVIIGSFHSDVIDLEDVSINTNTSSLGNAGNISIGNEDSSDVDIEGIDFQSVIRAGTDSNGEGGLVFINGQDISLENVLVEVETLNSSILDLDDNSDLRDLRGGDAGEILIGTNTLNNVISLTDVNLATSTQGFHEAGQTPGDGGDITIGSSDSSEISIQSTSIRANTHSHLIASRNPQDSYAEYLDEISYDAGAGGSISIIGRTIDIAGEDTTISTTAYGDNIGGDITIDGQSITIDRSRVIAETSGATENSVGGDILVGLQRDDANEFVSVFDNSTITLNGATVSTTTGRTQLVTHDEFDDASITQPEPGEEITLFRGLDPEFGLANAGNVFIGNPTTASIDLTEESTVQAQSFGEELNGVSAGNSGNIAVRSDGEIIIDASNVSASVDALVDGGEAQNINITTGELIVRNGALIEVSNASSQADDVAGDIAISASNVLISNESSVSAETIAGEDSPANISFQELETLQVENSAISSSTESGIAGDVIIEASQSASFNGTFENGEGETIGGVEVEATGDGGIAGNIEIITPSLTVENGAQISATTDSQTKTPGVNDDSNIPDVPEILAGNITINSSEIMLLGENSGIIAGTTGADNAGSITLQPDSDGETLNIAFAGGAEISATTSGSGDGGDVVMNGDTDPDGDGFYLGAISLEGDGVVEVSAEEEGDDAGNAGTLQINTQQFNLGSGVQILAESLTSNGGNVFFQQVENFVLEDARISVSSTSGLPGGIVIQATNSARISGVLDVDGDGILDSAGLFATNETAEIGEFPSGILSISSPLLIVEDGARIETSTEDGIGGTVSVSAQTVILRDSVDDGVSTGLFSVSEDGNSGGVRLTEVEELIIQGDSRISTSTNNGLAGGITINNADNPVNSIQIRGTDSGIFAAAQSNDGSAQDLTLNVRNLDITNGGEISTSNVASNFGGNIAVQGLDELNIVSGRISSSTAGGVAGSVVINANGVVNLSGEVSAGEAGGILAEATDGGDAGRVEIVAPQLTVNDSAAVTVSSKEGFGLAGDIEILASSVELSSGGQISAETDRGSGGSIRLEQIETLQVRDGLISASTASGEAGNILVDVGGLVFLDGNQRSARSGIRAESTNGGNAGSVNLQANTLVLQNNAQAAVSATGSGTAGELLVVAEDVSLRNQAQLLAETEDGIGGDVRLLELNALEVVNSRISASTNTGKAGDITIEANDSVRFRGTFSNESGIGAAGALAASTQGGSAGSLTIRTADFRISNQAIAGVSATESGIAGNLNVSAGNVSLRNQAQLSAETISGSGGNVVLRNLNSLNVINSSQISASTENGRAGSVTIGQRNNPADVVTLRDNARIVAEATGNNSESRAGNVTVNARDVNLRENSSIQASNVVSTSRRGGDVLLQNIDTLDVLDSQISASTVRGRAGSVTINADDSIRFSGTYINPSGNEVRAGAIAESTDGGRAGSLTIRTTDLVIRDGAQAGVSATRAGNSGDVTVTARSVTLDNDAQIAAETERGRGGDVEFRNVGTLNVTESRISASTGRGTAGNVTLNGGGAPADQVFLNGGSIIAEATGNNVESRSGNVSISARDVNLTNNASIAASNRASIPNLQQREIYGNISLINLNQLAVEDSLIATSTETGVAGSIEIDSNDSITLQGMFLPEGQDEMISGGIQAVASNGGEAGSIDLTTSFLTIRDAAALSVSSEEGFAGSITATTNSATLDNGLIEAVTGQSGAENTGATINLTVLGESEDSPGFLRLSNESLISASALERASGGNLNIDVDFVIAPFPTGPLGSDIIANAEQGDGGAINITALGLFGIQFRLEATPLNDITATSDGGAAGVVALDTPGNDPARGFAALPVNFVDLSGLVGQGCAANAGGDRASSFTLTGQGGLPVSPTDSLGTLTDAADWVTLDEEDFYSPSGITRPEGGAFNVPAHNRQVVQRPVFCYQAAESTGDRT